MMLLDTGGLLCLLHRDQPQHVLAQEIYSSATTLLTHNYVLDELVAVAHSRRVPRQSALTFSRKLLNDPEIEVVWVDENLHRRALDLLFARSDKTYSLCDAVSFVLMRERGETEALTTDRHFEQEGLIRMLVP